MGRVKNPLPDINRVRTDLVKKSTRLVKAVENCIPFISEKESEMKEAEKHFKEEQKKRMEHIEDIRSAENFAKNFVKFVEDLQTKAD